MKGWYPNRVSRRYWLKMAQMLALIAIAYPILFLAEAGTDRLLGVLVLTATLLGVALSLTTVVPLGVWVDPAQQRVVLRFLFFRRMYEVTSVAPTPVTLAGYTRTGPLPKRAQVNGLFPIGTYLYKSSGERGLVLTTTQGAGLRFELAPSHHPYQFLIISNVKG